VRETQDLGNARFPAIEPLLKTFHRTFPFLEVDPLIEYFALFGGIEDRIEIDLFGGIEATIQEELLDRFTEAEDWITPSYLMDDPYRQFLMAIARGDGKLLNIFRRAKLSEAVGGQILQELEAQGILRIESSREPPLRRRYNEQLPRALRGYRIQSKVRFVLPFHRFWFGFIAPYDQELVRGRNERFWEHFRQHRDRALSLVFEQLSNALFAHLQAEDDPVVSSGSWWDRGSEYDLLAITRSGRMILGECKYKGRKVSKGELTKLKEKARNTGLAVDTFALFSRNGFSKELREVAGEGLLLFSIEDFEALI
jgi:hypothetical protein